MGALSQQLHSNRLARPFQPCQEGVDVAASQSPTVAAAFHGL